MVVKLINVVVVPAAVSDDDDDDDDDADADDASVAGGGGGVSLTSALTLLAADGDSVDPGASDALSIVHSIHQHLLCFVNIFCN